MNAVKSTKTSQEMELLSKRISTTQNSSKDLKKKSTKFQQSIYVNQASSKNKKVSLNQISHYVTIVALGFYFIIATIPYGIILSIQNNLTLRLNYQLQNRNDYLTDPLWVQFGQYRDYSALSKLLFVSNHCLNFFFYFVFNTMFRETLLKKFGKICKYCKK